MRRLDIKRLYITGLALDYCVFYSAIDAKELGYDVFVVQDATRGITDKGVKDAIKEMEDKGISIIMSSDILPTQQGPTSSTEPSGEGQHTKSNSLIILLVSFVSIALSSEI